MVIKLKEEKIEITDKTVLLKMSLIYLEIRWPLVMICKESVIMTPTSFRDYLIWELYLRMQTQWIMIWVNNSFTQKYVLIKYIRYIFTNLVRVTGQNV